MAKWNFVKTCKDRSKHYHTGTAYVIKFKAVKIFEPKYKGWSVIIYNTKTKEKYETYKDWNLYFKTSEDAINWSEKYARYSYFEVYGGYKNWISREETIPGSKKTYKVWRPENEEEWEQMQKKHSESVNLFKINFATN